MIADDGFPGTVVRVATRGVRRAAAGRPDAVRVTVAAGEDWDRVVASCVATGLAGVECLSGIPGLAGATPIQNVGAYGQEVAETITGVRVYDRAQDEVADMAPADCGFGYRTSVFKRDRRGRFVVLGVSFELTASGLSGPVRYAELARSLGVAEGERVPLADVRAAVLGLRRGKGMVVDPADPDSRSAGSFFTNPVLDDTQFAALRQVVDSRAGPGTRIPQFPAGPGRVKVPAAWLIGQAGFHPGYRRRGPAGGRCGWRPGRQHGRGGAAGRSGGDGRDGRGADLGQAHTGPGQPGWCQHRRRRTAGEGDPGPGPRHLRRRTNSRADPDRRHPLTPASPAFIRRHPPAADFPRVIRRHPPAADFPPGHPAPPPDPLPPPTRSFGPKRVPEPLW